MALPQLLVLPDQAGYAYTSPKDVIGIALDGGLSRTRRDIMNSSAILDVSWTLSLEDYQYLRAFYNGACNRGTSAFTMELLLDQPYLEEFTCQFVPNSFQMSSPFGLSRSAQAQLEVIPIENKELADITYKLYELFYPCPIKDIFSPLAKLVNIDWYHDTVTPALAQLVNEDLDVS